MTDGVNCGAAIVADGLVLAAVNEERLSRLKMAYGFPRQSIAEVIRLAGIAPADIERVTVATEDNYFVDAVRPFDGWLQSDKGFVRNAVFNTASRFSLLVDTVPGLERLYYTTRKPLFASRRRAIGRILRQEFDIPAAVEFIDHHYAHATSAYFTSGFKDATVVTMDGGGDRASSHVYSVRDGEFTPIGYTSAFNSLGNYYAYVTHICGFKAQKHEGKITGLAAHGRPVLVDLLDSFITLREGRILNLGRVVFHAAVRALGRELPDGWNVEDLAASIQQHSERIVVGYVAHHLAPDRPRDLALAGGVFANVRINQKVHEMPGVGRLFVHPGMTDCGLAVGAALADCARRDGKRRMKPSEGVIRHVYLGPGYSDTEIEAELGKAGLAYERPHDMEAEIAKLLVDGHVVARFNANMEYGPRALGNRSILYHAADPTVNDWLNELLKRTEFMPFAPSTLMEYAGDYYVDYEGALDAARFMTITFDCTNFMKKTCPGVVHVDGTARPQLVVREENPSFYRIIDEFRKLTGIATIVNTSFNMHEEPIVCSPADAIRAFRIGHLDYLAIGGFIVPSPAPISHPLRPMSRNLARAPESPGTRKWNTR